MEALDWSTGLEDRGMLLSLAGDLHPVMRDEQFRKHAEAKLPLARSNAADAKQVVLIPNQLASRMHVAKLYYEHIRSCGWKESEREPWGRAASAHDPFAVGVEEPTAAQGGSVGKVVACFLHTNKGG